jgi:DNA-directed RNA polymerase specialized sigma24 family protein
MLRDFEGLETSEICEKMEKSQGAVHVLYHRACAKLSELLAAEGIDNAQF